MARFLSTNQNSLLRIATSEIGVGGKRGAGVPGYGVPGCGKYGVWKTRGLVENMGSGGKHGVWWKSRGLSGKHGV